MRKSLLSNSLFLFLSLTFFSCDKEPCLDIPKLDEYAELTKSWFVNDTIGNTTFIDKNGLSQTLIKQSSHYNSYDYSVEDDCGNIYGSFSYSISYRTSLSDIFFLIDIAGNDFDTGGFFFRLGHYNPSANSTEYDFYTQQGRDKNADIKVLPILTIGEREFKEVLEIKINKTLSPKDVKSVYYAKGYGIIKFTQENGNFHEINSKL